MERRTPLWLSHHWPEDYERCARLGRRHVCRRCLVVYPTCVAVSVLALVGLRWPWSWDPWVVWLLPLPAALEWCGEHLGRLRYSPRRNVALSAAAAVGVGVAFARYLERPTDPLFWAVALTYGAVCLAAALLGWHRGDRHAPRRALSPERTADPGVALGPPPLGATAQPPGGAEGNGGRAGSRM